MIVEVPEIKELIQEIHSLRLEVNNLRNKIKPSKLWYRREDLAELRNLPVSAFYNRRYLYPGPPQKINGVDMWSYEQVFESGWIWKTDEELKESNKLRIVK